MQFEALGRDIAAAANSEGDSGLATAVIAFANWFGLADDSNMDALYDVQAVKTDAGATLTINVKERDVFVPQPFTVPDPVTAPHDLPAPVAADPTVADAPAQPANTEPGDAAPAAETTNAEPATDETTAEVAQPEPAAEPAEAAAPAQDAAEPVSHDQVVVDATSAVVAATATDPAADPTVADALTKAQSDVETALAQWPDSAELQDLKTQLENLAAGAGA